MSEFTPEQKKIVEEILSIKQTDYYKVLKVEKDASDVEIKKSYRKLAIKLHPDKNKHPKASEAFKVIAKAFEILGDDSKRKIYDMTGSDPDSRSAGMGGAGGGPGAGFRHAGFGPGMGGGFPGFQGFPQGGAGGGINEDLLNMLFGMGGLGGMGGNGFSFQFGGNGFPNNGFYYSNTPGMNARRRAAQQQQQRQRRANGGATGTNGGNANESWSQYIIQFLPLLIILLSIIINSFSGGSNSTDGISNRNVREFSGRVPKFNFEQKGNFKVERSTPKYDINYYLEEKTVDNFKRRNNAEKELKGLDKYVEQQYVENLSRSCLRERRYRDNMIQQAEGIFFNDWDKIKEANEMPLPNCEKLDELYQKLL